MTTYTVQVVDGSGAVLQSTTVSASEGACPLDVIGSAPLDYSQGQAVVTPTPTCSSTPSQESDPKPVQPASPADPPTPKPEDEVAEPVDQQPGDDSAADPGKDEASDEGSGQRDRSQGNRKPKPDTDRERGNGGNGGNRGGRKPSGGNRTGGAKPEPEDPAPVRDSQGRPTIDNPTASFATPGPAPLGVPNFFIEKFRIPPFLLPIYQAAGIEYNVPWQILAAVNEIETDYGRNLSVSSAGAMGWMQFIPSSWEAYGVDANGDGKKDPYNPVDAIFAAARYLRAAGAEKDIRRALYAYNHAWWYVDSVMMRAKLIGGMPADLVSSLTGLTQGLFPVHATARYADDIAEARRVKAGENAALPVESDPDRTGIDIFAREGAPVIAAHDGRIVKIGQSERLGRYFVLEDVNGNRYTYAHLGEIAKYYPALKEREADEELTTKSAPPKDPAPTTAATAGKQPKPKPKAKPKAAAAPATKPAPAPRRSGPQPGSKERLFANPTRPRAWKAGGKEQVTGGGEYAPKDGAEGIPLPDDATFRSYFAGRVLDVNRKDVELRPLQEGSQVVAGAILGKIGRTEPNVAPHLYFEIRPAGKDAPRIDPKPILDGWKLLESTAIYRAQGKNPLFGPDARSVSVGQILLMSKQTLMRRVLSNPRIEIYPCGRQDIAAGEIDRRVLVTLEFLASSGLRPAVSSLKCGHSYYTAGGRVSYHSMGNAADIWKINGVPIYGNQGKGSITDIAVRKILTLQGNMKPAEIITLMKYEGTDNTFAMGDHDDHIHVGFAPRFGQAGGGKLSRQYDSVLKPDQWIKLVDRLNEIDNPTVPIKPSKYSLEAGKAERDD